MTRPVAEKKRKMIHLNHPPPQHRQSYPMMEPIKTKKEAVDRYMWATAIMAFNRQVPMPPENVVEIYKRAVAFLGIHEDQGVYPWIH